MEKKRKVLTLAEVAEMEGLFITVGDVARIVGLSYNAILKIAKSKRGDEVGIKAVKFGSVYRIYRAEFLRAMGWTGKINGYD